MSQVSCRMLLALALALCGGSALAQDWPTKPVKLVVGFPPGGTTDVLARLVATRLGEKLGQQFIVDNRGGASGMIGTDAVAKAPADGYTLLFSSSTLATYQALYPKVPFDAARDFEPVATVAFTPYVMVVHPSLPVHSMQELVAYAKKNPGKVNYAASSPGGGQHLAWEMFKRSTQTDLVYVPYKGTGSLMPDLLSGTLQAGIDNVAVLTPYIKSGQLRALAVTSEQRSPLLPSVPTAIESGFADYKVIGWFGVFAPAKTPPAITQKLAAAVNAVMNEKPMRERLAELGAEPQVGGPEAMRKLLASETAHWGKLIKDAGIVLQ
ncbi:tripartite tricarboxylate transporter substrate binding protein [Ramlibacter sp. G-1-2-2]|uniref:Tripartite tricarboxylate transporter substrate binding protein n=1 Tax=Ramlibacter agri TaxID=2728837 RepID=A0A848HEZ5_9BURK|nr:tripartite tricarboxylate transporter substrate binding protein [Ramlibacter agri]NML46168.1 tripartite tricarboxylate transporter substrate binding protein [Ramlibacter agri]